MGEERCVMNEDRPCIGSAKAALLEHRIEELERWKADSKKFHNDFYDWQRQQIARDAKLDEKLENMSGDISELLTYQKSQQEKPGKLFDTLKANSLWAVIGAFILFALAKIGL